MAAILTLIGPLDDGLIARIRSALAARGAAVSEPVWLDPRRAADLPFSGPALEAALENAMAAARQAIDDRKVDALAVPAENRRKRLLVADLESTLIENEMLDEIAAEAGIGAQIAAITRRAMNGEIDFAAALRERVALLKGVEATEMERLRARIRLTSGAGTLIATMRRSGAYTAIVTGGFGVYSRAVRAELGCDAEFSNEMEIAEGRLTGRVVEPIFGRDHKLAALLKLAAERGIDGRETLAVGDGANDIAMLRAAGLGIAFHAKPAVQAVVPARVDHGDLTALLFAQGYRRDEFVTA